MPLLSRFEFVKAKGVEECHDALARLYGENRMHPINPRKTLEMRAAAVPVGDGVTLTTMKWSAGVETFTPCLDDCHNFVALLEGTGQVTVRGHCLDHVPGRRAVVMAPKHAVGVKSEGAKATVLCVKIDRTHAESQLGAITGTEVTEGLFFEPDMPLTDEAASIWRFVEHVAREINAQHSFLAKPLILERVSPTLLTGLLYAQPHTGAHLLRTKTFSAGPTYVRKVEEFIEAHSGEKISAQRLAEVAGASVSALYRGFRKHRGYTPMDFLKRVRLRSARQQLLAAPPGCSVTRVASQCGFLHFGRFSAEYSREYGESPSDTLRRQL